MKFRVQVKSTRLTKLGGADAIEVKAASIDGPGELTITVPIEDARDYKAGDVVQAEVRVRREGD